MASERIYLNNYIYTQSLIRIFDMRKLFVVLGICWLCWAKLDAQSDEKISIDSTLMLQLNALFDEDQKYRKELPNIIEKYGAKSPEMIAHWQLITQKDSINLLQVEEILDTRGWLGEDCVGEKGSWALFLVIQHADLEVQEKYIPSLKLAVAEGKASAANLALMEDRIAVRKGEPQIYGSQVGNDSGTNQSFIFPIMNPENLDKRRAEVGLPPYSEYLEDMMGKTWNLEEYEKNLPKYEELHKRMFPSKKK